MRTCKDEELKRIELLLYSYLELKCEITNLKLDIEMYEAGEDFLSVWGNEKVGKTNKVSSSVENTLIKKEEKINKCEIKIRQNEIQVAKIENALKLLNEEDRDFIELRYFKRIQYKKIAIQLDRSLVHLWRRKLDVLKNMCKYLA